MLCVLTHVNIMQIIYSKRDKYLPVHKQRDFYVQEKKGHDGFEEGNIRADEVFKHARKQKQVEDPQRGKLS